MYFQAVSGHLQLARAKYNLESSLERMTAIFQRAVITIKMCNFEWRFQITTPILLNSVPIKPLFRNTSALVQCGVWNGTKQNFCLFVNRILCAQLALRYRLPQLLWILFWQVVFGVLFRKSWSLWWCATCYYRMAAATTRGPPPINMKSTLYLLDTNRFHWKEQLMTKNNIIKE